MRFFRSILAVASLLASTAIAFGQAFPYYPTIGVPGNTECLSYGNGGVCNQYRPAGTLYTTGNETIPLDTNLPNGQNPQTERTLIGMIGKGNGGFVNALIGGDFNTNLWQRGTSFASQTPTTAAYGADRWFMYSSGNTVTVNKQTGASDIDLTQGVAATMRVVRPSGTDVTDICVGQVLPAKDAARFLGNNAVFSFYAKNGASMSSVAGAVKVSIAYVTQADSATVNTVTDAFAKSTATGYTNVVASAISTSSIASSVASGIGTIPLSTTMTRYYVAGTIPTTATSVGVKICYTPVGTGVAADWFEIGNAQLEAGAATTSVYTGQISPSGFTRRPLEIETGLQQSYSYGLIENTGQFYANPVNCTSTANAQIPVSFPTQMRIAPTVAVTAGGWSIQTAAAVTAIGTTTLVAATTQQASLTSGAACTTTLPYVLKGTNTTGLLMFSAEP